MSTVVLTREDLRLIDPVRMQTQQAITLPGAISGSVRELGVTNDGLVLIDALHQAYSLYDQRVRGPTRRRAGLAASRDGSRVFFGQATNSGDVPYRYYDASTRQVVVSSDFNNYSRGTYTRHAEPRRQGWR